MALVVMMAEDEDALYCDLAETYGIFNWEALPVERLATLSIGLRDDSRIKLALAGAKIDTEIMLLAAAVDRLTTLVWQRTKDGAKGRNRPESVVDALTKEPQEKPLTFTSGREFEEARARLIWEIEHG